VDNPFPHPSHPGVDLVHAAVREKLAAAGMVIGPDWLRTILNVLLEILSLGHSQGWFAPKPADPPPPAQ
jgi:hypothetical protein